jgi:hypothetical protein
MEELMAERRPDGTTRGGQEPPDEVTDRPEQNATYDAVVDGADVRPTDEDFVAGPDNTQTDVPGSDPDSRAERDAAAEVRRQQRSDRR